jgi:hypothetical protein
LEVGLHLDVSETTFGDRRHEWSCSVVRLKDQLELLISRRSDAEAWSVDACGVFADLAWNADSLSLEEVLVDPAVKILMNKSNKYMVLHRLFGEIRYFASSAGEPSLTVANDTERYSIWERETGTFLCAEDALAFASAFFYGQPVGVITTPRVVRLRSPAIGLST